MFVARGLISNFLAIDSDDSDRATLFHQWHRRNGANTRKIDPSDKEGFTCSITPRLFQIRFLDRGERFRCTYGWDLGAEMKNASNLPMLEITTGERTMKRSCAEGIGFAQPQCAMACLAELGCLCQDRVEHGL